MPGSFLGFASSHWGYCMRVQLHGSATWVRLCGPHLEPRWERHNRTHILVTAKIQTVKFSNFPISIGKHELSPLLEKINSFNLPSIFPKLDGKHPWNSLIARTRHRWLTNVIGQFKRIFFLMKIALNSLLNISVWISPSYLLNQMSMYFKLGNCKRISRNSLAKWLLPRSTSCRSLRFKKLRGITHRNYYGLCKIG